jgi:atypical dual specificity phosphatase
MNFGFVVPGILAGCARPYGAGSDDDLSVLNSEGIVGLVSLTESPLAADSVARWGFEYLHIPVRDFGAPSMDEVRTLVEFVRRVSAERSGPVAVHCGSGLGRTGTMLACFLVSQGQNPGEAIAHVRKLRPGSIETEQQEAAVSEWWDQVRHNGSADPT